ncbi:hydrogenase [Kordiimonas sediminis]|uniref:Hydrogenase n=1 Tax=Kordiimonas sediminis TaxID=1735581 RepID=A0A919E4F7_9PROT|nr:cytochrome b/b6 domain-containing protein [Kordiimonas sediminis]GHF12936.1 hydrogenase [Kordiimonas sediminis]
MRKIKIWDLATRLFHWSLVVAFVLAAYSAFEDKFGMYADMHLYSGIAVLILISWRIIWGLIGSDTARFSHFVKSPAAAIRAFGSLVRREPYSEVGHNPLGGYAVILMLVLLLIQPVLGLFSSDDMFFEGPLVSAVDGSLSNRATEIHELLGLFLIGFTIFHVVMIMVYALLKRVDLVRPMITGRAYKPDTEDQPVVRSQILAFILLLVVGSGVCLSVF